MAEAVVGDDFYGEDPTVVELQERVAALLGTEAALLTVSGGMANLVAIMGLAPRGTEVVAEADSDLVRWEAHATATVAGVQLVGVRGDRGVFDGLELRAVLRTDDWRAPRTGLVVVENSHSASGGRCWPLAAAADVHDTAHEAGVPLLCDGARLFNASVAAGRTPDQLVRWYDVVNVSLYKGLGAPMGALVCGPAAVLERAAWARRVLGGTLRQAGVVAAAGLVALDDIERLREDHELAGTLAGRLADVLPPSVLPSDPVETNIVVAHLGAAATAFVAALQRDGVLVTEIVPGVVRFVTHRDVDERAVDRAVTASTRAFADVMPLLDGAL